MRYNRIEDHFLDQMQIPVSARTINNFIKGPFERLEFFESWVKDHILLSALIHADETRININEKRNWLHTDSNDRTRNFVVIFG